MVSYLDFAHLSTPPGMQEGFRLSTGVPNAEWLAIGRVDAEADAAPRKCYDGGRFRCHDVFLLHFILVSSRPPAWRAGCGPRAGRYILIICPNCACNFSVSPGRPPGPAKDDEGA